MVSLSILEKPLISSRGSKYSPGESLVLPGCRDDRNGLTVPPSSLYCLPYKHAVGRLKLESQWSRSMGVTDGEAVLILFPVAVIEYAY